MGLKLVITGVTGMVGEGVLFECMQNEKVDRILIVGRRHYEVQHPKVQELIVPDFFKLGDFADKLQGYDACLFCSGVSSIGMNEEKYTFLTFDTTLAFAKGFLSVNPGSTFCYVSGSGTDSSERGKIMWARVKGRTENELTKTGFKAVYNFRPGAMYPFEGQRNWKSVYKFIVRVMRLFFASRVLSMQQVGRAMINVCAIGYSKPVMEIADIKKAAEMN